VARRSDTVGLYPLASFDEPFLWEYTTSVFEIGHLFAQSQLDPLVSAWSHDMYEDVSALRGGGVFGDVELEAVAVKLAIRAEAQHAARIQPCRVCI
jgi:hypothetical protein